jgi:tRNA1(Val) A37 N6-methylase TrmN6
MTDPDPAPDFTEGTLLGGRVAFRQPATGYRAAIDPVMLAAAAPATSRRALDLGCGAGAASLCLLARVPGLDVTGIEIDKDTADLARHNAEANGWAGRFRVLDGDVASFAQSGFDLAIANPPYVDGANGTPSPDPDKRRANREGSVKLADWIDAALRALVPGGTLLFVQRADRLADMLAALDGKAGEIVVFPLWPRHGQPAKRVLLRARKGIATPLRLAAGLVLHEAGGAYTAEADAILRGGAALALDASKRV